MDARIFVQEDKIMFSARNSHFCEYLVDRTLFYNSGRPIDA